MNSILKHLYILIGLAVLMGFFPVSSNGQGLSNFQSGYNLADSSKIIVVKEYPHLRYLGLASLLVVFSSVEITLGYQDQKAADSYAENLNDSELEWEFKKRALRKFTWGGVTLALAIIVTEFSVSPRVQKVIALKANDKVISVGYNFTLP